MSDTMTVKQACEHGRYDMHYYRGEKTERMNQPQPMDRCPGGKEIVLRQTTLKDFTVKPDDVMYVEADDETV